MAVRLYRLSALAESASNSCFLMMMKSSCSTQSHLSTKDASWRKRNGFDKCVSQSGGKGSAVKYSVSKINEWLTNGKVSKK